MNNTISLKKNIQFKNVYNKGKKFLNKDMIIYILKNDSNINKLGIVVSKKVGNSVVRHHLKRLIKESYRLKEMKIKKGFDIIVIARYVLRESNFFETQHSLFKLLEKANLVY